MTEQINNITPTGTSQQNGSNSSQPGSWNDVPVRHQLHDGWNVNGDGEAPASGSNDADLGSSGLLGSPTRPAPSPPSNTIPVQAPTPPAETPTTGRERPIRNQQSGEHTTTKNKKGIKKNTRAHLTIASLNMRGVGTNAPIHPNNKWNGINFMLRDKKIGVLALQETHLSANSVKTLEQLYGRHMKIFHTSDRTAPSQRAGVAIILNKEMTNIKGAVCTEIVAGRALHLSLPWHKTLSTSILAIYAPNSTTDNKRFWEEISAKWDELNLSPPDIMLGDFNMVEDTLDRFPAHADDPDMVAEFVDMKSHFGLSDGWRTTYPDRRDYSFSQEATGSRSRIDRIYVAQRLQNTFTEWEIQAPSISTDHRLASTVLVNWKSPYISPGRWSLPKFLLHDKKFMSEINEMGMKLTTDIAKSKESPRSNENNVQDLFTEFKEDVKAKAQARAKVAIPKMEKKIKELKVELESLTNSTDTDLDTQCLAAAALTKKIEELERQRYHKARVATTANYEIEGETVSKYWSNINKKRKPRDPIYELQNPDPEQNGGRNERRSDKMADIMKTFFDGLQHAPYDTDQATREVAINEIIEKIPTDIAQGVNMSELAARITKDDIEKALKTTENGKAEGLDGIPYEFYKILKNRFDESKDNDTPKFDIISALTEVYLDVETNGCLGSASFAEGWVCPLYKKNDPTKPSNYRPITLLNTDYKIYTKAMALKLAKIAPGLIHENQAGFVPGRSIFDHVQLSKMMINYAEATEENGVIIALDQEKAYDRIAHDYLWRVLEKFAIPTQFINSVKAIYQNAHSTIFVNGERSHSYAIIRGVRQGDPLSCLLFNLAIEPLAEMLRLSELKGYAIPKIGERVITTLFADDTTVYLSEEDDLQTLENILKKWCTASGAKFNLDKTELIPIGSEEYRESVITTRRLNENNNRIIPDDYKIAKDGTPVRSLGAWIGNKVEQASPWSKTLEKIAKTLKRWKKCSPTLRGKVLIIQMVVAGMTQYLTRVQGMPKAVEKTLQNTIRDFIWDGKRPMIGMDQLSQDVTQGGIKLIDLPARNEAIDIIWLKSFLDLSDCRPTWAYVADALIGENITRSSGDVHKLSQINIFLQTWKTNFYGASKLPKDIQRMLRVAGKYDLTCNAIRLSKKLKKKLPIWYHFGAKNTLKHLTNSITGKCLRENHQVTTVGDLTKIKKRLNPNLEPNHTSNKNCTCHYCQRDRTRHQCDNPHRCAKAAERLLDQTHPKWDVRTEPPKDHLTLTKRRKRANKIAIEENEAIIFNPATTVRGSISRIFRIFANPEITTKIPGLRPRQGISIPNEEITVYVSGAYSGKKKEEIKTSYSAWFGNNDPKNTAKRTNLTSRPAADVAAIMLAVDSTPNFAPLHIVSTSSYATNIFTLWYPSWEAKGWIGVKNREIVRATLAKLRNRSAVTTIRWVRKENATGENEKALQLAQEALGFNEIVDVDTTVDNKFDLTGAELASMTQALAYKGIRERRKTDPRNSTTLIVNETRAIIHRITGWKPVEANIWRSIRDKAIRKPVSDFLWRIAHGAYRVGNFWKKIPGYEDRGQCLKCEKVEDMEHILFRCSEIGQKETWDLAKSLWTSLGRKWHHPNTGTLLGARMIPMSKQPGAHTTETGNSPRNKKKKWSSKDFSTKNGAQRLLLILLSESAYLIWKLRNERRVRNNEVETQHSQREIENRWYAAINARLTADYAIIHSR